MYRTLKWVARRKKGSKAFHLEQADAVEQVLRRGMAGEIELVTNSLVIAEIVWTLESYYHLSPLEVQDKILAIINTPGLEVVDGDLVIQAILWHVEKAVDFIDAFNAAWMMDWDIRAILTFDRTHFSRLEGIEGTLPGENI